MSCQAAPSGRPCIFAPIGTDQWPPSCEPCPNPHPPWVRWWTKTSTIACRGRTPAEYRRVSCDRYGQKSTILLIKKTQNGGKAKWYLRMSFLPRWSYTMSWERLGSAVRHWLQRSQNRFDFMIPVGFCDHCNGFQRDSEANQRDVIHFFIFIHSWYTSV